MCSCNNQLQPHEGLKGVCFEATDEPKPLTYGERHNRRARALREAEEAAPLDPVVVAYDAHDLRLMADMEGGH